MQKNVGILESYFEPVNGGRSSMVEPQIVVLVVAGSSPVGHPAWQDFQVPNPKLQHLDPEFGVWSLGLGIF